MSAAADFTFRVVEDIRTLIEAGRETGPFFRSVESTLEAARNRPPRTPAAIVYPLSDDPARNVAGRAGTVERVTGRVNVLHVIGAPNDPLGGRARAETGRAVELTRKLLLGPLNDVDVAEDAAIEWPPEDLKEPLALVRGQLEDIVDGRVYWSDIYAVEWVLDAQSL